MLAILTTHPIQYQVPLWRALAAEGSVPFEVWYMTDHGMIPSYDKQFGKSFAWDLDMLSGYRHRFVPVKQPYDVGSFHKLRLAEPLTGLIKSYGVTALWVQGWQVAAYWQAVWQGFSTGVPIWLRGESNDLAPPPPVWKKLPKRWLLKQFFNRVRNFLYIGAANRRLYESYGVNPEQLYPAPYCVDNERFARQANLLRQERLSLRRAWNIPDRSFCVLFAGKFISKKRPLDLIAAARKLHSNGVALHLLFVGSGTLGGELRRACNVVFDAEISGIPDSESSARTRPTASFAGFLNQGEISQAYVAADCLVLPSDSGETWGLVANEAMASGLPCIASDACGCGEDLIAPINERFRFPLGDTGALSDALLQLIRQPCPGAILQKQVDKFRVKNTVTTVSELYHSATDC